jgi:hypothetical protein
MRRRRILIVKLAVLATLINFAGAALGFTFTNRGAISIPSSGRLLMSDVGGGTDVTALTITLDDAASSSLANPLTAGIFKPTNVLDGDTFPASAPAGPYGAQLSVFNGASANGTWQLFVFDDSLFAAGSIANGWSLEINGQAGTAQLPEEPAVLYVGLGMFVGAAVLRRCFRKPKGRQFNG